MVAGQKLALKGNALRMPGIDRSHRIKGRNLDAHDLNNHLDAKYSKLLQYYEELLKEDQVITAQAVKERFQGSDARSKSLLDVIEHHSTTMGDVLKWVTLKNYIKETPQTLVNFITLLDQ